jgi:hypothetical protein
METRRRLDCGSLPEFLSFLLIGGSLGGFAIFGEREDGRFYIGEHNRYREVSRGIYAYQQPPRHPPTVHNSTRDLGGRPEKAARTGRGGQSAPLVSVHSCAKK